MATLSEIAKNPELATEEDKESLLEIFKEFERNRPFFEMINNLDPKLCAPKERHIEVMYWEHLIKCAILDCLSINDVVSTQDLLQGLITRLPDEFQYNVSFNNISLYLEILQKLELVEKISTEEDVLVSFKITELGKDLVRNQSYKTLALSAFFNRETYNLNKKMLLISNKMKWSNYLMIIISLLMLLIAVGTFIATFYNDFL